LDFLHCMIYLVHSWKSSAYDESTEDKGSQANQTNVNAWRILQGA
jgi:hypothetical protein